MGRLKLYRPEYHDAWGWSLAIKGATDVEIADAFDVTEKTINRWKFKRGKDDKPILDKHGNKILTSFGLALENGKEAADAVVEKSLYKRAIGYEAIEEEKIIEYNADGTAKPARVKTVKKPVPPDTMACMYWLNNRKRKTGEWSQKQDITVNMERGVDLSNLTEDELRKLATLAPKESE